MYVLGKLKKSKELIEFWHHTLNFLGTSLQYACMHVHMYIMYVKLRTQSDRYVVIFEALYCRISPHCTLDIKRLLLSR